MKSRKNFQSPIPLVVLFGRGVKSVVTVSIVVTELKFIAAI